MKKSLMTMLALAASLTITGCGIEDLQDSGSGHNSVKFDKTDDGFKITLEGIDSDYVHVKYELENGQDSKVLSYGLNYNGKVITTCSEIGGQSNGIEYSCTTKYDTSSPVGDPEDKQDTIVLSDNGNTLSMVEVGGFNKNDKTSIIKTF